MAEGPLRRVIVLGRRIRGDQTWAYDRAGRATALVADELVSMVDASLRVSIVNLLGDVSDSFGVTVI